MPQRFLRPGIRTSQRWNSVSRDAQALYIAILTLVDDFGRYDGRPSVLHGDAFSVWNEANPKLAVNPQRTAALCGELQKASLVHFYEVKGKKCLQMIQWEERIRDGAKEKWPKPNESDIPQDSAAERSVALPPSSPSSPTPSSSPAGNVAPLPRFQKPSVEEVNFQAGKIGLSGFEAEKFYDFYESNGWRVGKNPMKSWTSAMANWKRNAGNFTNGKPKSISSAEQDLAASDRLIASFEKQPEPDFVPNMDFLKKAKKL